MIWLSVGIEVCLIGFVIVEWVLSKKNRSQNGPPNRKKTGLSVSYGRRGDGWQESWQGQLKREKKTKYT